MIDCSTFLEAYSDYRDGLLPREKWESFQAHVESCSLCARYDRVIGGGVEVFVDLPHLAPSPEFEFRLQHRLYDLQEDLGRQRRGSGASIAVTLTIALAIGMSAWLPALRQGQTTMVLPPVLAQAPQPREAVATRFDYGSPFALPLYTSAERGPGDGQSLYPAVPFKALVSYSSAWVPSMQH